MPVQEYQHFEFDDHHSSKAEFLGLHVDGRRRDIGAVNNSEASVKPLVASWGAAAIRVVW